MTPSRYHGPSGDVIREVGGFKYATLKSGRRVSFYDAQTEAKRGLTLLWRSLARMSRLAAEPVEGYDFDWNAIGYMVGKVEELVAIWQAEIEKHGGRRSTEERVAALRQIAGRTPNEAAMFLAKADELERELDG